MNKLSEFLDKFRAVLNNVDVDDDRVTVSVLLYANNDNGNFRTGNLEFKLSDVLTTLDYVDKKLTSIRKLKKRIEKLEARQK